MTYQIRHDPLSFPHQSEPSPKSDPKVITMWGIDPVVAHYKPTEPKHLNPLQRFSMYLSQVSI